MFRKLFAPCRRRNTILTLFTLLTVVYFYNYWYHNPHYKHDIYKKVCIENGKDLCPKAFKNLDSKWRAAPRYKIASCVIEKSMSTVLAALTCFLYNSTNFIQNNRSITSDIYQTRLCQNVNEFKSISQLETTLKVRRFDWMYFTVVRDPIERFFSGFVDKCLRDTRRLAAADRCFGCKDDIDCVVDRLHRRAMAFSDGRSRAISFDDIHFFPQNWHCNMKRTYEYLKFVKFASPKHGEYHDMVEKMLHYFGTQGVDSGKIEYIRTALKTGQTRHSTSDSSQRNEIERRVRSTPALMKKLVQTFYFDMMLFGFAIPDS